MKNKIILLALISGFSTISAQDYRGRVGINTEQPSVTLDVTGNPNSIDVADGIVAPRLTKSQLLSKTAYSSQQIGAIVYVTDVKTNNVLDENYREDINDEIISVGYYYFNGTKWLPLEQPALVVVKDKNGLPNRRGIGFPHRKENPDMYGSIGTGAVDLSYSTNNDKQYGALGRRSFAIGRQVIAQGNYSFGQGEETEVLGDYSTGFGSNVKVEGGYAFAQGYESEALGEGSVAMGNYVVARGASSYAGGVGTEANGYCSYARGVSTSANSYAEHSRGVFNISPIAFSTSAFDKRDLIESVGGGENSANPLNLFERYKSGAFKWNAQVLNTDNIPNANKGFHAADENGKLNYYNGTEWESYISVKFLPTAPVSAKRGDIYFNTSQNKYFAFDGTNWNSLW